MSMDLKNFMGQPVQKIYSGTPLLRSTRDERILLWPSVLFGFFFVIPSVLPQIAVTVFFLSFLFFPATIWLFSKTRMPAEIPQFAGPLLLIILVGLLNFTGHKTYDIARDVFLIMDPAIALIVGYALMSNLKDLKRLFRVFVISASVIALFHLATIAMHPEILNESATSIRMEAGAGYFSPAIAVALFLAARKMKMKIFGIHAWLSYLTFSLCMLSTLLSFSRTIGFSLILISLAIMGWVNFESRIKVTVFAIFALVFIGISALVPSTATGSRPGLADKVMNSFQEMKIKEYHTLPAINEHWRGFETSRALITYSRGTLPEYFVGQGLGTPIDLGLYMPLGRSLIRFAPTVHNGYMYLLVKTGIIGVLLYLFLLYRMIATGTLLGRSESRDAKYCGRLLVGIAMSFVSSSLVITGMFNDVHALPLMMLTGALLAYCRLSEAILQ